MMGDAVKLANSYAGEQAKVSAQVEMLQAKIGTALQPALASLLQAILPVIQGLAKFTTDHPQLVAAITFITLGITGLVAVLGTLGLAVIGLSPLFSVMAATATVSFGLVGKAALAAKAIVSTPMVMPALVIAAALASIYEVYQAVQSVRGAIDAMNNAQRAANSIGGEEIDARIREYQKLAKAAKAAGDQKKADQYSAAISTLYGGGRARGGPVKAGTAYLVGENPDGTPNATTELFVPNQSGTIVPANKAGMGAGVTIQNLHVNNNIDVGLVIRQMGWMLQTR
jgi:hypothetical protein